MPTFLYQSKTTSGESRTGTIAAPSRAEAIRTLISRGEAATQIVEAKGEKSKRNTTARPAFKPAAEAKVGGGGFARFLAGSTNAKPKLSRTEMANLMRELATALEAGLPLMQALRTVRKQASGKAMPVILDHFITRVEAGDQLHQAAREYGPPFDDLIVGMLRAADASGKVSEVLHQLSDLLERSLELRREVMGATFYPLIVAVLIAASAVVLVTVLVPTLIEPLAGQITLPWPTRVVLGIATFIKSSWMWMAGIIAAVIFGWRWWSSQPANRLRIDLFKLRAPVLGRLMRDVAVARFTRTLGTLSSAGLPMLESLRITKQTLGNKAMEAAMDEVQDQVTHGKALADPLERSGLFPALLIQVVNLGERSGRLEQMLIHAATAFDRQVNTSLKLFTKALPPFLLIIMAGLGSFVLAAVILPLLELQNLVDG
jgi:type II secretory pathway component PulF